MNMWKHCRTLIVGAALAVVAMMAQPVQAATFATLNIDVTISNALSVAVSSAATSTVTYQWDSGANRIQVAAATATVTNDSGGLTERWNLKTVAQTIMSGGATQAWDLLRSTAPADVGPEQFSVQAQLLAGGTAAGGCPAAADATWTGANGQANLLDSSAQIYGAAHPVGGNWFENAAPDIPANDRMYAFSTTQSGGGGIRALCWKVIGPTTTANVSGTQNVQIIVTAQNP